MDEKHLNRKIFQPLSHLDMDPINGVQKYYNDFFCDVTRQNKQNKNSDDVAPLG